MIAILDYGMANLRSVQKAFEAVGHAAVITSDPQVKCDKLVLPGVGAFRDAIAKLHETGLDRTVLDAHRERQAVPRHLPRPADALRAQLRGRRARRPRRLRRRRGALPGRARPQGAAHGLEQRAKDELSALCGTAAEPSVYFVHGYYVEPADRSIIAGVDGLSRRRSRRRSGRTTSSRRSSTRKRARASGLQMLKNFARVEVMRTAFLMLPVDSLAGRRSRHDHSFAGHQPTRQSA